MGSRGALSDWLRVGNGRGLGTVERMCERLGRVVLGGSRSRRIRP